MANTFYKSDEVTLEHIKTVQDFLKQFEIELSNRGFVHDASKFSPIEREALEEMQNIVEKDGQAPFGSEEYERRKQILKPMLDHHYENNSHHPEHYSNGIDGMNLGDLVEMFFDWRAAVIRNEDDAMNLSFIKDKYNVSDQLLNIFKNTCDQYGFRYK